MRDPRRWLRVLLACAFLWASDAALGAHALAGDAVSVVAAAALASRPAHEATRSARRRVQLRPRPEAAAPAARPVARCASSIRPAGVLSGFVLIERPYLRNSVLLC